jgi:hypothetical protein
MDYPFEPVSLCCAEDGYYLQFGQIFDFGFIGTSDSLLTLLRGVLLRRAALLVSGQTSLARAADCLAPDGVTSGVSRNRWARLGKIRSYTVSSRRMNGTVNACKRDVTGYSSVLDTLLDDNAPLWQMTSKVDWSLTQLMQLLPKIYQLGLDVPPVWDDDRDDASECRVRLVEASAQWGLGSLASLTVFLFCLRRSQAIGGLSDYAWAYHGIRMALSVVQRDANGGSCSPKCDPVSSTRAWNIDREILTTLWMGLGLFVQTWCSRVRLHGYFEGYFHVIGGGLANKTGEVVGGLVMDSAESCKDVSDFVPDWFADLVFFPLQRELDLYVDNRPDRLLDHLPRLRGVLINW